MTTDLGRKVMSSTGTADARLTMQESGFKASSVSGQVSEKGHGYVVAVLTGTWSKPEWRVIGVVPIAGDKGLQYIKGESDKPDSTISDKPPGGGTGGTGGTGSTGGTPIETPEPSGRADAGSEPQKGFEPRGEGAPEWERYLSLLDGYRILLPWRVVPGFTLDGIFLIALFIAVGMVAVGLVTRKK